MRTTTIRTAAAAIAATAALVVAGLGGCAYTVPPWAPTATATLSPTAGNGVTGTVRFARSTGGRTLVTADVTGLRPDSEHGFHVHERGDCSAPDAASAGGHYNPANAPHGNPATLHRHAGDLPNLRADASGRATLTWLTSDLEVRAGASSVLGRSVIVHADRDDYLGQPAGNSGARLACGVIQPERSALR